VFWGCCTNQHASARQAFNAESNGQFDGVVEAVLSGASASSQPVAHFGRQSSRSSCPPPFWCFWPCMPCGSLTGESIRNPEPRLCMPKSQHSPMHACASPPKPLSSDLLATGAAGGAAYQDLLGAWGGSDVLGRLDAIRMMLLQPDRCAFPPLPYLISFHHYSQCSSSARCGACMHAAAPASERGNMPRRYHVVSRCPARSPCDLSHKELVLLCCRLWEQFLTEAGRVLPLRQYAIASSLPLLHVIRLHSNAQH